MTSCLLEFQVYSIYATMDHLSATSYHLTIWTMQEGPSSQSELIVVITDRISTQGTFVRVWEIGMSVPPNSIGRVGRHEPLFCFTYCAALKWTLQNFPTAGILNVYFFYVNVSGFAHESVLPACQAACAPDELLCCEPYSVYAYTTITAFSNRYLPVGVI